MEWNGPAPHPDFVVFVWGDFVNGGTGGGNSVGKDGLKLLLPKTSLVRLEVVVANIGNVAQKHVPVTASLQQGGGLPDVAQNFVDLSPGKRQALTVRGLKAGAGDAVLTVTIGPLAGETSVVDNTMNLQLSIHP